jgi:ketosteroid isomerase-like protein
MMWDGQPEVIGHEAIHEFMSRFSGGTGFDFQGRTDEIQIVGDWAFHRYSGVAVMSPSDGGDPIKLDRKYIDILRRENGTWRISHHIYNLNVPSSPD